MPVEPNALAAAIDEAAALMVERQSAAGIDIVNDGEMSKPSYATYIKDRLRRLRRREREIQLPGPRRISGHQGQGVRRHRAGEAQGAGVQRADQVRDMEAPRIDAERLVRLADGRPTFMSAVSPGTTSLFFANEHYPSHEAYLFAIADALRARI